MTEIVTSPGGEQVEVLEDADFLAKAGEPPDSKALRQLSSRGPILRALWENGVLVDEGGQASRLLLKLAAVRGYEGGLSPMSGVLRKEVMQLAIERDINGKRVYLIELARVPRKWLDYLSSFTPAATPEPVEPEPAPEPEEAIEAAAAAEIGDVLEAAVEPIGSEVFGQLEIMQGVASALLAQVVDIVTTGKPDTQRAENLEHDLEDASRRLSASLEESERLRRRARNAEDECVALKSERDGLRQRLRLAESNLAKALSPTNQRVVNELVQNELAKVMRATPVHHSPDDAPSSPFPPRPAPTHVPPQGR